MGEGLQRAFAAARATQGTAMLDAEMGKFLLALKLSGGHANGRRPYMPSASRAQDAARKKCKQRGLAFYVNGEWHITQAGREALASTDK